MHQSSLLRMKWFKNNYLSKEKKYSILDVGSYGVNGTYKELFIDDNFSYCGLDVEDGPNVDLVPKNIYSWQEIKDDQFDVVISGQAFEHIEFFWITMQEIARVLKKDGLVCIIAPNGFEEHRYPVDCWRFFSDGMIALARWTNLKVIHAHTNSAPSLNSHEWFSKDNSDSMLIAKKEYSGKPNFNPISYECVPLSETEKHHNFVTYKEYNSPEINHSDQSERFELPKDFEPSQYLLLNPDVAAAKVDPSDHYLNFGRNENRLYKGFQDQSNKFTKYNFPKIFMALIIKSTRFIKKIRGRLF